MTDTELRAELERVQAQFHRVRRRIVERPPVTDQLAALERRRTEAARRLDAARGRLTALTEEQRALADRAGSRVRGYAATIPWIWERTIPAAAMGLFGSIAIWLGLSALERRTLSAGHWFVLAATPLAINLARLGLTFFHRSPAK